MCGCFFFFCQIKLNKKKLNRERSFYGLLDRHVPQIVKKSKGFERDMWLPKSLSASTCGHDEVFAWTSTLVTPCITWWAFASLLSLTGVRTRQVRYPPCVEAWRACTEGPVVSATCAIATVSRVSRRLGTFACVRKFPSIESVKTICRCSYIRNRVLPKSLK